VGRVPGEKRIQRDACNEVKGGGYHGRKVGGPECRGGPGISEVAVESRPQNGRMETWTLGAKGERGWALVGEILEGEGSKASGRKRAASNASRRCLWHPDALEAPLSLPDAINTGGRT